MTSLVVEVLSPYTRRRDREQKRDHYMNVGVSEYWIIDPDGQTVTQVRPAMKDEVAHDNLTWFPGGVTEALVLEVGSLFS